MVRSVYPVLTKVSGMVLRASREYLYKEVEKALVEKTKRIKEGQ